MEQQGQATQQRITSTEALPEGEVGDITELAGIAEEMYEEATHGPTISPFTTYARAIFGNEPAAGFVQWMMSIRNTMSPQEWLTAKVYVAEPDAGDYTLVGVKWDHTKAPPSPVTAKDEPEAF